MEIKDKDINATLEVAKTIVSLCQWIRVKLDSGEDSNILPEVIKATAELIRSR